MANLLTLHELEVNSNEVVANSTSSEEDPIQSASQVEREVLANMEVGRAPGVKFQPNSAIPLGKMIDQRKPWSIPVSWRERGRAVSIPSRLCGVSVGSISVMKIISWNIRGMGSYVKKNFLRKLIKRRRPDLIFVQETKLESLDRFVVQKLWGNGSFEFVCSNSIGASGGLMSVWNKEFFKATSITIHRSFILLEGSINNTFPCCLVNFYAPTEVNGRRLL